MELLQQQCGGGKDELNGGGNGINFGCSND